MKTSDILTDLKKLSKASETTSSIVQHKPNAAPVAPSINAAVTLPLCAVAAVSHLPKHILDLGERNEKFRKKLLAQVQLFECPAWASVSVFGQVHLEQRRSSELLAPLMLDRDPYYLLGRDPRCCHVLEHPSISGVHSMLAFHQTEKCFVVMDLKTSHGVFVDDAKIDRMKPVGINFGSTMRFGLSARTYVLRKGEPLTKQAEELKLQAAAAKAKVDAAGAPPGSDGADRGAVAGGEPVVKKHRTEDPPPPVAAPVLQRHLRHLLIKHKDVEKPKSAAPRNKGEVVTRSKEDAFALAHSIKLSNAAWTEQQFVDACAALSEDAKAGKGGDLGLVDKGDFPAAFDSAAFAIGVEQVSLPVESPLGIHLIFRCAE